MAYNAASTVNLGLQGIGNAITQPTVLQDLRARREREQEAALEARKVEAEANYKDKMAAKEQQAAMDEERQKAVIEAMPKIDLNSNNNEMIKQMRAQWMFLNNNGMGEEAKRRMSETKNLIASSTGETGTIEEETQGTLAYKQKMQGQQAEVTARYTDEQRAPQAAKAQAEDMVALDAWITAQEEQQNNWFIRLFADPMYNRDILFAEARAAQQQLAATRPISIIEAAQMVIANKAQGGGGQTGAQPGPQLPQAGPQVPQGQPQMPSGTPRFGPPK